MLYSTLHLLYYFGQLYLTPLMGNYKLTDLYVYECPLISLLALAALASSRRCCNSAPLQFIDVRHDETDAVVPLTH